MPFYLAIPRRNNAVQRRQSSVRTEYQRTAPSTVFVMTYTTLVPTLVFTIGHYLHLIYMSALLKAKRGAKVFVVANQFTSFGIIDQVTEIIPLPMPSISFSFLSEPTEQQEEKIREWGMHGHDIRGKGRMFSGKVPLADLTVFNTWANLDHNVMPTAGTIRSSSFMPFGQIRRLVTAAAQSLTLAYVIDKGSKVNCVIAASAAGTDVEVLEIKDLATVATQKVNVISDLSSTDIAVAVDATLPKVHGTIADLAAVSDGIFLPFEPNYSGTDQGAMFQFLQSFSCLFSDRDDKSGDDENNLIKEWTNGICYTPEGEALAHMMASTILALRTHGAPFFLFRGPIYEGTILHGAAPFSIRQHGVDEVSSMDKASLENDIKEYATHSSALTKILAAAKVSGAVPDDFVSMRQLRDRIFGANDGVIPGTLKNILDKNLGYLYFNERPIQFNPVTLENFLKYIDPAMPTPIPETLYLDRDAFFCTDQIELALAAFGRFVPSPSGSGMPHPCVMRKEGSVDTLAPAPTNVKFHFKGRAAALADWKGFMTSYTMTFPDLGKLRFGQTWSSDKGRSGWTLMCNFAVRCASAKKSGGLSANASTGAAKRRMDDDGQAGPSSGSGGVSKKARILFDPNAF